MAEIVDFILWVLVFLSANIALVGVVNVFTFKRIPRRRADPGAQVTVCVPARNEAHVIDRCVRSLCAQEQPLRAIRVLDDASDDGTGSIVAGIAASDPRVELRHGKPLPAGWIGKTWACHQLSADIEDGWLLFVDADTTHDPAAVASLVAIARERSLDLVCALPRQRTESLAERIGVPLMQYIYYSFIPLFMIQASRRPAFTAANGQVMLVRAGAYHAAGGHAAVRSAIVDDVRLARRMKEAGYRIALLNGADLSECRMYDGWASMWEGFTKNLYPGIGFNATAAAVLFGFIGFVLLGWIPGMAAAWLTGSLCTSLPQLALLLALPSFIRALLSLQCRLPLWHAVLQPASLLLLCALLLGSARAYARGGARWKGRTYDRETVDGQG